MHEFFEQRSLEQALSDLLASYQRRPEPALAEMIQKVQAEIACRDATCQDHEAVQARNQLSTRKNP